MSSARHEADHWHHNTIHQMPHDLPRSPLPWKHLAEVAAEEVEARGFRRTGVTGTR
ncbi:MAG: hypothetical protein U1E60_05945 [Reyranellaceae bacterium]